MDPQREKAMRSIFVANIAFETTEDELKAVLCEVNEL
jgi:RNA recognition motif-containing protein